MPGLNTEETRLIDVLDNLLSRIKSNRNRLLVAALVLAALVLALGVTPLAYADEDTTETTTATETKADDKAAEDKSKDEKADDKTTVAAAEEAVAAATEDELLPAAKAKEGPKGSSLMGNDLLWADRKIELTEYIAANDVIGAGETIIVKDSSAGGSYRLSGRVIKLTNSKAGEAITLAGQDITVADSTANAIALAGQYVSFSGVTGDLWIYADKAVIDGLVTGNAHIVAGSIEIGENAQIDGTLSGETGSQPKIAEGAVIAENKLKIEETPDKPADFMSAIDPIFLAISVANCLLIALLAEWVASDHTAGAATLLKKSVLGYLGAAVLGTIVVLLAIVLLCVPIVTIPASLAVVFAICAIALVSNGFTAAALGRLIFPNMGRFKSAILMGILVGLLCGLPYVGAPVRGLAFLFMMGYAIRSLRVGMLQRREERNQEVVQF